VPVAQVPEEEKNQEPIEEEKVYEAPRPQVFANLMDDEQI
jgi:hypothetical protein